MNTFVLFLFLYSILIALVITFLSYLLSFIGICPKCFKYLKRKNKKILICKKCNSFFHKEEKKIKVKEEKQKVDKDNYYYKPLIYFGQSSYFSEKQWDRNRKFKK